MFNPVGDLLSVLLALALTFRLLVSPPVLGFQERSGLAVAVLCTVGAFGLALIVRGVFTVNLCGISILERCAIGQEPIRVKPTFSKLTRFAGALLLPAFFSFMPLYAAISLMRNPERTLADLRSRDINYQSVEFTSGDLCLISGSEKYWLSSHLILTAGQTEDAYTRLKANAKATIFLLPNDKTIYGLSASGLDIPPKLYLDWCSHNRRSGFYVFVISGGFCILLAVRIFWLARKNRESAA